MMFTTSALLRSSVARTSKAFLCGMLLLALAALPAAAHTGFESSDPSDGAVLDAPVSEIQLVFTGEATPAGEGFVALNASGVIVTPTSVTSTDNLTWLLSFDEPLSGGTIGVRWTVQAPDTHPISGSFSFEVTAPAVPTTSTTAPTTTGPSTVPTTAAPSSTPESTTNESATPTSADPPSGSTPSTSPPTEQTLEDFLAAGAPAAVGANAVGAIGRFLIFAGTIVGLGAAVFQRVVLGQTEQDHHHVILWIRRGASLLVVGTIVDLLSSVARLGASWSAVGALDDWSAALDSSFGLATLMRLVGGVVVMVGATTRGDRLLAAKPLAVGAGLILVSFSFDGHTVTEGARWLHAVVNVVHVSAAVIWGGGVLMLANIVWRRSRRGEPAKVAEMAIRFSGIAGLALAVAGLAGTALTIIVLDEVSEIWSTGWGRVLIAKMAAVGIGAAIGAYNHFAIVPLLSATPTDVENQRLRSTISVEAAAILVVIVLTGILVGANSN